LALLHKDLTASQTSNGQEESAAITEGRRRKMQTRLAALDAEIDMLEKQNESIQPCQLFADSTPLPRLPKRLKESSQLSPETRAAIADAIKMPSDANGALLFKPVYIAPSVDTTPVSSEIATSHADDGTGSSGGAADGSVDMVTDSVAAGSATGDGAASPAADAGTGADDAAVGTGGAESGVPLDVGVPVPWQPAYVRL